jgi:type 1 glutamine amidotransferase
MALKRCLIGLVGLFAAAFMAPVAAQQAPAAPAGAGAAAATAANEARPIHVYIRAGLKTHGPGQHDYPQFLADWSKLLTEHGAVVDGGLHFPTAEELSGVDVLVMYKGDAGTMLPGERAVLENYLKRGGGLVSFHDTLCGDDPAWYATIVGGAKKHGEVNYTLDAPIPYTVKDASNPIMKSMSDITIQDEAFFLMTWAPQERGTRFNVLATAKIAATPSAGTHAGEEVPQIWTYERTIFGGQPYRAFVWMQGHEYKNFSDPHIQPMLLRGIAWAAHAPVESLVNARPARQGGAFGRGGRGGRTGGRGMGGGRGMNRGGGQGAPAPAGN